MEGNRLGPYLIDRELGSGGMGKVYAAVVDGRVPGLDEGTRVALKVVHAHLLETPGFFKRFLREAEIGKVVRHPNVVRTYDCDATGGQHFMAMEYVEGQTLRELLVELDRVPEELCRHIGHEVASGPEVRLLTGVPHPTRCKPVTCASDSQNAGIVARFGHPRVTARQAPSVVARGFADDPRRPSHPA